MQNIHRSTQIIGRAALVALLAAPALGAQGRWEDRDQNDSRGREIDSRGRESDSRGRDRDEERRLFAWRGTVDHDTRIYVRGGRVQSEVVSGSTTNARRRVDSDNALPRRDGVVRVQVVEGRGRVYVIQQPNARNDYTAILRVQDTQRGAARYRFVAYFDPVDGGRRRDRNGVWRDVAADGDIGDRVLRWSGNIDGDTRISLWRGQVGYQVVSGQRPHNVQSIVGEQLPRRNGHLTVSLRQGRGSVVVIEQPSPLNNYTAVVRVLDGQSGYGYYDFDLHWR